MVTEVPEGAKLSFGCSDIISKDNRPHRNPFVFVVHGVQALLDAAHTAVPPPTSQAAADTQEARPVEAQPQPVPHPMAPEPLRPRQQQQQQEGVAAQTPGAQPALQSPQGFVQPVHAAEHQPDPPVQPSAAEPASGPIDLTGRIRRFLAVRNGMTTADDIVDLTVEVLQPMHAVSY